MVFCKFYLNGNCRYGSNCKFEHVYNSKYSYHAPKANQQQSQSQSTVATDEQLVNQVRTDIQSVLNGGQWILSSYSPFKEKPNLQGLTDLSPEEARLFIYEAKANNTLDQAVAYMNNLIKDAQQKHQQLMQPTAAILRALQTLYRGEKASSPFTQNSTFGSSNAASSVFRSAVQNTSPFGQSNQTPNPASIFAQANQSASSIFAQANQNAAFSGNTSPAASIFAQANQSVPQTGANIFGNQQPMNSMSEPNIFESQQQRNTATSNIFETQHSANTNIGKSIFDVQPSTNPVSGFGSSPFSSQSVGPFGPQVSADVYSKLDELTESDIAAFKSDKFELGLIPDLPPPQELCV